MKHHSMLALACGLLLLSGCSSGYGDKKPAADAGAAAPAAVASAAAQMSPTEGNTAKGTVTFTEMKDGTVVVVAELEGLTPGEHAMHVHEKGDCSAADASSAGPHFNPTGSPHGQMGSGAHHGGDMPNIVADQHGVSTVKVLVPGATLEAGPSSITGRAVVVHRDPDDYSTQPAGNAGPRIACGVIE